MQPNLKDILSQMSAEIDQETLMLYLQGKLTPEKQHELEKQILDNEFAADAIDGLQDFKDKKKLAAVVEQLNNDLRKKTAVKKARRRKRTVQSEPWLLITLVIILVLVVLCYFILFRHMGV
jgi:chromatin segregation and condensation protein Rec8/ScpA/Scc1 (kleisin family)